MAALSSSGPPPPPSLPPFPADQTRDIVSHAVHFSLVRLCGGGVIGRTDTTAGAPTAWHQALYSLAVKSVSFTNGGKSERDACDGGGKPHDIEVRAALSLFHRYKHNDTTEAPPLQIVSDLGLGRPVNSATELAQLIALDMERHLGDAGTNVEQSADSDVPAPVDLGAICDDIRPAATSGILCLTTKRRVQQLRHSGKLPCPQCIKWCNGEKGLWWHRQMEHGAGHGDAVDDATNATDTLALVAYDPAMASVATSMPNTVTKENVSSNENYRNDPFECAKNGDLKNLIRSLRDTGLDPATATDTNGSNCLHWSAGGGHLDVVKYLIETCRCCPNVGQEGKRSFRDRTALHWASRNGHLDVAQYLLEGCNADIEAATMDGTTAFCWASWQGHLDIMQFLYSQGCDVHAVNSFGCNATLWAAQGEGGLEILKWLRDVGCHMRINGNGHSVLHKSAQRGKREVIEWVLSKIDNHRCCEIINLIGPDQEEHCPSDLAGMEGHADLAEWLAEREKELAVRFYRNIAAGRVSRNARDGIDLPEWLAKGIREVEGTSKLIIGSKMQMNAWEAGGGIRRMCCHVILGT